MNNVENFSVDGAVKAEGRSAKTTDTAHPLANNSDIAVDIKNLGIRRGKKQIFENFNAQIKKGKITGLLGPSGCGKSTLIRAIVGVQKIQSGSIRILGDPAGSADLRSRVSYSSQADGIYKDLNVQENIAYFAKLFKLGRSEVKRVIEITGLEKQHKQRVSSLSGGQAKRVSLAIALLGSPELILLDEPTVGLDPVLRESLWQIFETISQSGTTLLVSSHVMDEATRCGNLLILRDGKLVADTTPQDMLQSTNTTNPEDAFLKLIELDAKKNPQISPQYGDTKETAGAGE